MTSAARLARRTTVVLMTASAFTLAACRSRDAGTGEAAVGGDGGTVAASAAGAAVTSGGNSVTTDSSGNVHIRAANGASIDVSNGAVHMNAGAPAGGAAVVTVTGKNAHRTVDCGTGGTVTVAGDSNVLTVTGSCAVLNVAGNDNVVHVAAVRAVNLPGSANTITYGAGAGGGDAVVHDAGQNNNVIRGGK